MGEEKAVRFFLEVAFNNLVVSASGWMLNLINQELVAGMWEVEN